MCWLFPCTPILGVSFRLESVKKKKKKCVCVINLKNAMLPMRSVFINVKKGLCELGAWLAAKHTTKANKSHWTDFERQA